MRKQPKSKKPAPASSGASLSDRLMAASKKKAPPPRAKKPSYGPDGGANY